MPEERVEVAVESQIDVAAATLADLNSPMMRPRRQKPRNYRRLATIGVDTSDDDEEEEAPEREEEELRLPDGVNITTGYSSSESDHEM